MADSYATKGYIKGIYLQLPDYTFHHRHFSSEHDDNFKFLGREAVIDEFVEILLNSTNNGAYLVTGYRGMGKTSFIHKVLKEYKERLRKKRRSNLKCIHVSFGKSDVNHTDLIKQIIIAMQNNLLSKVHKFIIWLTKSFQIFNLSILLYLAILIFVPMIADGEILHYTVIIDNIFFPDGDWKNVLGIHILLPMTISFILSYFIITSLGLFARGFLTIHIYHGLQKLYARLDSEVVEEENIQSVVKNFNFGFFSKSSVKFPPITVKEAEYMLINLINKIDKRRRTNWVFKITSRLLSLLSYHRKNNYVFVFDEMDKVEPGVGGSEYYQDMKSYRSNEHTKTYIDEYRDKKQMMINIISAMKNLVAETHARFIFVAGREMFEASLAEITDRQSPLGSIFHKVIYIDSFLKDKVGLDPAGLSNLIEGYLKNVLLPRAFLRAWDSFEVNIKSNNEAFLKLYYEFLNHELFVDQEKITQAEKIKIILALQQFIIYLTYRSNGSPKKVTRLIEDLLISKVAAKKSLDKDHLCVVVKFTEQMERDYAEDTIFFLRLTYINQFRFGFITYLYRPFILTYSRRIKSYSDYLLVSTTSLVDHIIKYHPFAFSMKNLELLPEVVSTNRSPQLRSFIDELLQFLTYSYVRETESRLFEYKFFIKVANELLYLTNIFEDESAAFNFTLDESFATKTHVRNKILELRSIHKDYKGKEYEFIHSISSLNNLLGDIRFFDQEYNDAITAYSDALQALRGIDPENPEKRIKIEMVILMIQLQLKIGLTYEKTRSYENALAYYSDAMEFARNSMLAYRECKIKVNTKINDNEVLDKKEEIIEALYASDVSLNELLQMAVQAFTANLFLIEKISAEGVTLDKIEMTNKVLQLMFGLIEAKKLSFLLIEASFYRNIASLLFVKNMHVQKIASHSTSALLKGLHTESLVDDLVIKGRELKMDFRMPNYSVLLNIKALNCLLDHCFDLLGNDELKKTGETLESAVQRALDLILDEKLVQVSDKNLLRNLAILLNSIGGALLTNLEYDVSDKELRAREKEKGEDRSGNKHSPYKEYRYVDLSEIIHSELMNVVIYIWDGKPVIKDANYRSYTNKILEYGIRGNLIDRTCFVLTCFNLSAKYYSLAGKNAQCSFMLKQILRLLNSVVYVDKENKKMKDITDFLEKYLLAEILRNTSTNANNTDRSQIYKYKYFFNVDSVFNPVEYTQWIYNNLSNNPEIREAIILYAELRIRSVTIQAEKGKIVPLIDLLDEQAIVKSENTISSQWVRVQELRLQVLINYKILREYMQPLFLSNFPVCKECDSILDTWRNEFFNAYASLEQRGLQVIHADERPEEEEAEFLGGIKKGYHFTTSEVIKRLFNYCRELKNKVLTDDQVSLIEQFLDLVSNSVHCLSHIVEVLQTYGVDGPAGHSFTADIHRYHAEWMQYYYLALVFEDIYGEKFKRRKNSYMQTEVESMIGRETLRTTVPMALYQQANYYYHRTLDMHRGGNIYKQYLQSQNLLEDDFNDSLTYFSASLERQRVNSGNIRENIKKIDAITSGSQLFKYRSYVNKEKVIRDWPLILPREGLLEYIKRMRKLVSRVYKKKGKSKVEEVDQARWN